MHRHNRNYAARYRNAIPSVVSIYVTAGTSGSAGAGSGFGYDGDGRVVTNNHVLHGVGELQGAAAARSEHPRRTSIPTPTPARAPAPTPIPISAPNSRSKSDSAGASGEPAAPSAPIGTPTSR